MALDCLLLFLLASAVAAMEGNVPFAEQLGGCRLPVHGCRALCRAPLAARPGILVLERENVTDPG